MKITSFNPLILTKEAEAAVNLMKALGFEIQHNMKVDDSKGIENIDMNVFKIMNHISIITFCNQNIQKHVF